MNNDEDPLRRDWLVISCYTAQRVSDMFKFNSVRTFQRMVSG